MKNFMYLLFFSICLAGCNNTHQEGTTAPETKKERSAEFNNIEPKEIPDNVNELPEYHKLYIGEITNCLIR